MNAPVKGPSAGETRAERRKRRVAVVGDVAVVAVGEQHMTVIDAADAERVAAFSWNLKRKSSRPDSLYAGRTVRVTPGRAGKKSGVSLHRFILDAKPGQVIDHINGNTLDNRRSNLRITDARGNSTNVTSSKMQKIGGYKGVTWHPKGKKWQATICAGEIRANGKRKQLYLGLFADPIDAALAYDEAARKHFGEFANLNFPEPALVRIRRAEQERKRIESGLPALVRIRLAERSAP